MKFIERWSKLIIVACLLMAFGLSSGLGSLQTRSILESELPEDDMIVRNNDDFKALFGDNTELVVILHNEEGVLTTEILQTLINITNDVESFPGIISGEIRSLATVPGMSNSNGMIRTQKLLTDVSLDNLGHIKQLVENNPLIFGRLVSKDWTTFLITFSISRTIEGDDQYEARVNQSSDDLIAKYADEVVDIHMLGIPLINKAIDDGIAIDTSILFPVAILIILVLLFTFFTSVRAFLLPIGVMIMAAASTMGTMGLLGIKESTVTAVIPVFIIALGSSYSIILFVMYYAAGEKKNIGDAFVSAAKPIILASVTSAIGFSTLVVIQILSLREFGFIAGLGILFTMFYTLVFATSVLFLLPYKENKQVGFKPFNRLIGIFLEKIWLLSSQPKLVCFLVLVILVISGWGISKVRVGSNPTYFFPEGAPSRFASELLNEKFSGTGDISIAFEVPEPEYGILDPVIIQWLWGFQKHVENLNPVGYSSSVVDHLRYVNRVLKAKDQNPKTLTQAYQFLELYGTIPSVSLDSLIDMDYRIVKVTTWMYVDDSDEIGDVYEQMLEYIEGHPMPHGMTAKFGGENMVWLAQNHYIVVGKMLNIVVSIIIIFLVCAVIFRALRVALVVVVPLLFSGIVIFGVMGFVGIRLDMASCVLTSVVIGVGVDFSIHYIIRLRENKVRTRATLEKVNQQAGRPILMDAISNILGFMVLFYSGFTPVRDLGMLIIISMVTCSIGTLVFLPIITKWTGLITKEVKNA